MIVINFCIQTSNRNNSPYSVKETLIKHFEHEHGSGYLEKVKHEWEGQQEYIRSLFPSKSVLAMFRVKKNLYFLFETDNNNDINYITLDVLMISQEINIDESFNTVIKDIQSKLNKIKVKTKPNTNSHVLVYPVIQEDIINYTYSIKAFLKRGVILESSDRNTLIILGVLSFVSFFISMSTDDYIRNLGFSLFGSAFITVIASTSFKTTLKYRIMIKDINDLFNVNPPIRSGQDPGNNGTSEGEETPPLKTPTITVPGKKVEVNA
ncbi:hypothetical protein AM500_04795 [Bacillus sp. FJAT-18017]|uniref:hypothetical protein n=1 Tax=Bacillus sp. FJAT-18017 TaxID=1705566 RepID=UPI0006AF5E43|nr:hypothetical protein [Bacillus sp. FJAT-18017]ALC89181.1 hypothetical protein AM500_04795 [Bacillus sp. FJAT-18017]